MHAEGKEQTAAQVRDAAPQCRVDIMELQVDCRRSQSKIGEKARRTHRQSGPAKLPLLPENAREGAKKCVLWNTLEAGKGPQMLKTEKPKQQVRGASKHARKGLRKGARESAWEN